MKVSSFLTVTVDNLPPALFYWRDIRPFSLVFNKQIAFCAFVAFYLPKEHK